MHKHVKLTVFSITILEKNLGVRVQELQLAKVTVIETRWSKMASEILIPVQSYTEHDSSRGETAFIHQLNKHGTICPVCPLGTLVH